MNSGVPVLTWLSVLCFFFTVLKQLAFSLLILFFLDNKLYCSFHFHLHFQDDHDTIISLNQICEAASGCLSAVPGSTCQRNIREDTESWLLLAGFCWRFSIIEFYRSSLPDTHRSGTNNTNNKPATLKFII